MVFFDFDTHLKKIKVHSDETLLKKALHLIPLNDIEKSTLLKLRAEQKNALRNKTGLDEAVTHEMIFLLELIKWFTKEFFKWFDIPTCTLCNKMCKLVNVVNQFKGPINKTEIFRCLHCNKIYEFHRYNDSNILLDTRCGRCHEHAQVFALICKALTFDTRVIFDITDHIWTEVYSNLQQRWIHCDPSEGIVDKPLIYEKGWNKFLSYVIAIGETGIQDVTWRYTSDHVGVKHRRSPNIDASLLRDISSNHQRLLSDCSSLKKQYLLKRYLSELVEFLSVIPKANGSYEGRQSGSLQWRLHRREIEPKKTNFTNVGHVFRYYPTEELSDNYQFVSLWYSANKDAYLFSDLKKINELKFGWNNYVYSFQNIKLKEECDWKKTYLARERNNEIGHLAWRFDLTGSNYSIRNIYVLTNFFVCEKGTATCSVSNDRNFFSCDGETKYCFFNKFKSSKSVNIDVTLSGGTGSNAWQHAQIARQSFEEGFSVSFGVILYLIRDKIIVR